MFLFLIGKHTAEAIKDQYEEVVTKLGISKKIVRIVGDQAANVKCAFKESVESRPIDVDEQLIREKRRKH